MALDEKTLERMLKAQKDALDKAKPAAKPATPAAAPERTDLFEEFRKPDLGDHPRTGKGLNALGYKFPPETPATTPAMTKANMAKGLGLPPPTSAAPKEPVPTELIEKDTMFEEYQRPDLKDHPRTGKGIRHPAAQPKTAKEILQDYQPPEPQVLTPRRTPTGTPADHAPKGDDVEADAAHLDAEADLASAAALTMSHSRNHGPTKVHTDEDPFLQMPNLPAAKPEPTIPEAPALPARSEPKHAKPAAAASASSAPAIADSRVAPVPPPVPSKSAMPAPSFGPAARAIAPNPSKGPSAPHTSDAPAVRPGSGPRIAIVQADFNHEITTRMADDAVAYARQLGCTVAHHLHVAGAYDIPLTAKVLAERADVDAVVAIGCIIQGETGHDQLIAREVARKLADLAFQAEKPIGLAVTGPRMTKAQAEARIHVARHAVAAVTQQWRGLQALNASPALAH
jgi:6,7-dimethyl-8-ribityllumazine synthase